jgi:hypothetical protein
LRRFVWFFKWIMFCFYVCFALYFFWFLIRFVIQGLFGACVFCLFRPLMAAFVRRNWRVMAAGLVCGAAVEGLLIRGNFYDQMRNSRAKHLDQDWSELDKDGKVAVLQLEERYRKITAQRENKS